MRTLLILTILAGVSLGQDNGDRQEAVVKSMLGSMDRMTKVLKTIQDEDTAKAALPELKKTADEWSVLRKQAETTPPPTKQEKERLAKEYKSKLEDAQKKLFAEIGRVQLVPGGREALADLGKVLAPRKD